VFTDIGKLVVIAGLVTAVIGLLLMVSDKTGSLNGLNWFGHLPLDFKIERENFRLYFPMGSSIALSMLLSMIFYLFNKFIR
jgi:Na+-driven multidrug efflux pump